MINQFFVRQNCDMGGILLCGRKIAVMLLFKKTILILSVKIIKHNTESKLYKKVLRYAVFLTSKT